MRPIFTTITIQWSIFLQGDKVGKFAYLFILFIPLYKSQQRGTETINKEAIKFRTYMFLSR